MDSIIDGAGDALLRKELTLTPRQHPIVTYNSVMTYRPHRASRRRLARVVPIGVDQIGLFE